MSKLYACIFSPDIKSRRETLVSIAGKFAHTIEVLDDGILFDASGLEHLIGNPENVAKKILGELKVARIQGNVGVADTVDTAMLLARQRSGETQAVYMPDTFERLPLRDLDIEPDTLNVFEDLGLRHIEDLLAISPDELANRYGREFESVVKTIRQKGDHLIVPNIKENSVSWGFELDQAVEDFEQLIFILNHGLEDLLARIAHYGLSTEQLDIAFRLSNKKTREYAIRTSFPTLEKTFWLKLINLRVSLDPPEATIRGVDVVANFTKPRPDQRGLYAVSRPEPESLLLTVNKIKKLVGEKNVGIPVLLDQRLPEAFALDADKLPIGKERSDERDERAIIAFTYFRPPVRAEVKAANGRLVSLRTYYFSGPVKKYSGVWKANSTWWDRSWKTQEWDVEVEGHGVYRLCKVDKEWFLTGEYD